MNKRFGIVKIVGVIGGTLALTLLGVGMIRAQLEGAPPDSFGLFPSPEDAVGALADKLNLSDFQRQEIQAIAAGERPVIGPVLAQMETASAPLQASTDQGTFDPVLAKAIAWKQAASITTLVVEAEAVKPRVLAVLTPDQQRRAREIWNDRMTRIQTRLSTASPLPDRLVALGRRKLDLSDNQVTRIQEVMTSGKSTASPVVTRLIASFMQLRDIDASRNSAAIREIAEKSEPDEAAIIVMAAQTKAAVFAVLTPKQREQLLRIRDRRRQSRNDGIINAFTQNANG